MATTSAHKSEILRARLLKAYHELPPDEKAVLQLMAVAYEPFNQTSLMTAVRSAKIRLANGAKTESAAIRKTIAALQSKGLVRVDAYGGPPVCDEDIAEIATRDAVRERRFELFANAAEDAEPAAASRYGYYLRSFRHAMRLVRLRLYRGQVKELWSMLKLVQERFPGDYAETHPLIRVCNGPFDAQWFASLPDEIADAALHAILNEAVYCLWPADPALDYLQAAWSDVKEPELQASLRALLTDQLIWRGRTDEAAELVAGTTNIDALIKGAWLLLLKGNPEAARSLYANAITEIRRVTGKRIAPLWDHHTVFHALALIEARDPAQLKQAHDLLKRALRDQPVTYRRALAVLLELVEHYLGLPPSQDPQLTYRIFDDYAPLDLLIKCLALYWTDSPELPQWVDFLEPEQDAATGAGCAWLAAEIRAILDRIRPGAKKKTRRAARFHEQHGLRPLVELVRRQEAWEVCLEALGHIADTGKDRQAAEAEVRLAWHIILDPVSDDHVRFEAREVKRRPSGAWTKGKNVSWKRLASRREKLPYLTPHDIAVCNYIVPVVEPKEYYGSRVYYQVQPRAWVALAGHPMVFGSDGGRVEVVKGEPELHVAQKENLVTIELVPALQNDQEVCVLRETPARIKVIECNAAHRRIAAILQNGLRVPLDQKARVLETLTRVTSLITIHSGIGGGLENLPKVPADARPHIVLVPAGAGLRVQVMVQPLAHGAYYSPGAGGETVLAEVDGRRVQTQRQLDLEREQAAQAIAACPALEIAAQYEGEWRLDDPEHCLELLEQLHDIGDAAVVEWPQGEKMRVSHRASFGNLQVKVAGGRNWFEASGQLRCGDHQVLDMRQLLALLEQTPGRFIPLGDGQFLSLAKEFRKRLDEFRALSEKHGDGVRFHPLAAPAVEGLFDGHTSFKANKAWTEHLERFREAQAFDPALPSTLRATLRDYQVEGYQWMARLARWGAGACLADDMGLGKTIQALALMLARAAEGPALVIAPTSVCLNWIAEAQRFAPTLNPILFGAGNRQAALDDLKPFDVLVCSYGLLHQEAEKLAAVQWRVAVLDEAQAIKNMTTRRSQAAMNLKADFRLITTGTPIENHLGELWNLFRFINPGLLRSLEQFNQRFAIPIEKHQDRDARARLKKIIQPFILRRVKEQVLEELPPRTEIMLHVEFSDEEAAFYEALRRQAVEKITTTGGAPGQKHLRILAEIMRLRRACCNAELVTPGIAIPSAKLKVFLHLVDELLDNRHKALVFSQFVDHLTILRQALDKRNITYQYLDGSTPQRQRKKRVDAFQAGEGDLFLISLKAGGLGLNLTAADYVIHMDPWWNPAAEDQASDRAHRIGQIRPVTIYRLVTEGTIESQIVELHRHKRDLADSLLDGAEMTGKMSADELLALLQEGM
jgi:superfamily II DNA or RNA helicase